MFIPVILDGLCFFFSTGATKGPVQGEAVVSSYRGCTRAPCPHDPAPLPLQAGGKLERPKAAGECCEVEVGGVGRREYVVDLD